MAVQQIGVGIVVVEDVAGGKPCLGTPNGNDASNLVDPAGPQQRQPSRQRLPHKDRFAGQHLDQNLQVGGQIVWAEAMVGAGVQQVAQRVEPIDMVARLSQMGAKGVIGAAEAAVGGHIDDGGGQLGAGGRVMVAFHDRSGA